MQKVSRSKFPRSVLPGGIGKVLRARRLSAGLSSADLARAIGTRRETVYRIEKGYGLPSSRVVFAIAKILGIELESLGLGWHEPADAALPCYGARIRHRRRWLKLTLSDVSAATGVSISMLSRFECEQSLPTKLLKIKRAANGEIACRLISRDLAKILGFKNALELDEYCNFDEVLDVGIP